MKKLYILSFALLMVSGVMAQADQPCYTFLPVGITFTTQARIDNFQTNYSNYTEILGYVTIQGNNITNLNGLNVLTSIGGDLDKTFNSALNSLTGLEGLTYSERNLKIEPAPKSRKRRIATKSQKHQLTQNIVYQYIKISEF